MIYQQSGVLGFRGPYDDLEIMVITNRKGTKWLVPKGLVEDHLSPAESAAKEAYEEAGIEGYILSPIPVETYETTKWGGTCVVELFALRVELEHATWPEWTFRRRQWLPLNDAVRAVSAKSLAHAIRSLPHWLNQTVPQSFDEP